MPIFICEQHINNDTYILKNDKLGVLIGPEGGWTQAEKDLFVKLKLNHLSLSSFTLRAETAAIVAVSKLF
jgi:RsmE family RNA methyltransferase